MAVQPVQENKSSGIMLPAAATAVGAGAGYLMAPAKYSSVEDLLAETNAKDVFSKSGLDGDAKTVYDAAKKAHEGYTADMKKISDTLFKGETKEVNANNVLAELGMKASSAEEKIAAKVAENIEKFAGEGGIIRTAGEGGAATYAKVTPELAKEVLGEKGTVEQVKTALDGLVGNEGKAVADKVKAAKDVITNNKAADEFLANATKDGVVGNVTKEAAEGLAKAKAAATTGLEKFAEHTKGLFGKNIGKGLAWGAGIGLVVGLACKLFSGKKEAA